MGRIGRWIASKINTYITGTIESLVSERVQAMLYGQSGDDSPPLPDDRVLIVSVDGSGRYVITGVLSESQGAEPGEKILYSRDSNGTVKATISFKSDGTLEINGNTDYAVSWTDLNTALQLLVTTINAKFLTKTDGVGSPGGLSLDISSAKVEGVKLP